MAYHNVVPHGCNAGGDRSLHLPQRSFAAQLDQLLSTHDIIPLNEIFSAPRGRRPRAVITFDDAYQGAVTAGVDELARRGLPATIFVSPGFLGGASFWWDVLSPIGSDGLPAPLRNDCLLRLRGEHASIISWAIEQEMPLCTVEPHQTGAFEHDLHRAVAAGITLAAHTWSHPNLAAVDAATLAMELAKPLLWLRQRFDPVLPWVSYPYGLCSSAVEQAASAAGYQGAFRVHGGWIPRDLSLRSPHALPRLNIPSGVSLRRFELNTSGVLVR